MVTGVEERGVPGVEVDSDRPHFKIGDDTTSFDQETGHFVTAARFQSLQGEL